MKRFVLLLTAILTFAGNLQLFADIPTGLLRIKNRRTSTAYLTSNTSGAAQGASKTSGLSQVWVVLTSGNGYTLRNAQTAEYLQADFATPASSKATLYIQQDKNANTYYNISSSSDFSGQTCLNLGNNGTQLNKWNCNNDQGSMWTFETVTDVTEDEVRQHFADMTGYVGELSEGKYYRIISYYGRALQDSETTGGDMCTKDVDASNISQYWTLTKSGNYWHIQNVLTERYIIPQTTTSAAFHTSTAANVEQFSLNVNFNIKRTSDEWDFKWTIAAPGESRGFHDADSQGHNMVLWSTSAAASEWSFQEAELTQEAIDAARGEINTYNDLVANKAEFQTHLDNLFEDKACTTLKADIAALSDEALAANEHYAALNANMKAMVLKVKNNTWQQYTNGSYTADYERFFRIADYKIYSHYQKMMNADNFVMSNSFGKLSGPTGIVANTGDIIYLYVNSSPKASCTLQLEAVPTDGVPGNHQTGTTMNLTQGLNIYRAADQVMLYIFHQLDDTKKYLADYPDIKVHIEGGQLNGYWDATRGMTNADWKNLQKNLLKASPVLNLKTEHLVFAMNAALVKQCEPNEMEGLMRIWDKIPENEERYMGVEDFEGRYRNIWNVFSIDYNYMFASTYGTYYNESTLETIMNYENMRKSGSLWGPSHEIGHNHQASINVIGTTESSNNMFSNINTFEQGIVDSRRQLPVDVFAELAKSTPWVKRNIWNTTSMFFQLYLYFHVQHHDDNFLPNLFRRMRKNPINKGTYSGTVTYTDGDGNKQTGANVADGANDYLHLAKMICDVAQADLSEFFEAYGMFVPIKDVHVGDYSNYIVTTTQSKINSAKRYMQRYPKKLGNIMFIDDHIVKHKANADNIFEGIPASDGYRIANLSQHNEVSEYRNLPIGDVGDYEEYNGNPDYTVSADRFTITNNTVSFKGKGDYLGHKFYDYNGNLIWATNAKEAPLPDAVKKLSPLTDYYVVAAQANMADVPCPYYNASTSKVYQVNVYFGQEDKKIIWAANEQTKLNDYLPENAVGVIGTANAPEGVTQANNIIDTDGTAKSMVINGNLPFYLPSETTTNLLTFTMENSAYAALRLPFDVTSTDIPGLQTASYNDEQLAVTTADVVRAGQPAVVNGNVSLVLANVALAPCNYQTQENILVLTADGQGVETAETAAPFLFPMQNATAITSTLADTATGKTGIYDMSGRKINSQFSIHNAQLPKGVYILNGKKVVVK